MQLLVIRHAIAGDASLGQSDAARTLTDNGIKRMRRGARGLRRLVPEIEMLVSSPLARAVQTAEIIADAYGDLAVSESAALALGAPPEAVSAWMGQDPVHGVVALVGHEPGLSRLITWLISGQLGSAVELKKGSACLIDCPGDLSPGSGTLVWALQPWHLRRLR